MPDPAAPGCATVVIGRNEGERLVRCLRSLEGAGGAIVYVDSGSSDGSVQAARDAGARVVELDTALPFTAGRARNAGAEALEGQAPRYIQFVDGDCELAEGWLASACAALDAEPELAVVCGRRRERHPERSVYNDLCDMEWDTPVGEAQACGGDFMVRAAAFRAVGGFERSIIAGEEPDLCLRLRARGWRVRRIDAEMTRHDAAMTRFAQWWRRAQRAGHAFTELAFRHGRASGRIGLRPALSACCWALLWPLLWLGAARWLGSGALVPLLLGYAVLALRVARGAERRGRTPERARRYAAFIVLGKFAQLTGAALYLSRRLRGRRPTLIEYKGAEPSGGRP